MRKLVGLLFLISFVFFANAQQNYSVSGKVVDKNTGETLPGASVHVLNSKNGTTTDEYGNFNITKIQNPKSKLVVSFIGYLNDTIVLNFSKRNTISLKVKLISNIEQLAEVSVTDKAKGQVKAIIEQKRADNIKNVVSSEQIEQFPDLNAGEAMQRIPGITLQRDQGDGRFVQLRGTPPEFTNFNVNGEQIPSPEGDVRYVGMDIISADQIDQIEITKVLTPDMDADGIGGSVNIRTKKAESKIPEIKASIVGGYSDLRESGNYQTQFSFAQRQNKLGFLVNGSYYINNQGSDNMEFEYDKGTFFGSQSDSIANYHIQFKEAQLRHYEITRKRIGISSTIDYEFSDKSYIYLRGMFNQFSDYEIRRRKIYTLDDALSEKYYLYGGVEHDIKEREKLQNLSTLSFGGNHKTKYVHVDYELAYSKATENQPDRMEVLFENPGQAIGIKFDMSDPNWPVATFPNPDNAENAYRYDEYEMDELLFLKSNVVDENYTAKANFKIPYKFENKKHKGFFKFGGKTRQKSKTRDVNAQVFGAYFTSSNIYPGTAPELSMATVADDFSETNLFDKGYAIDNMPSPDKMRGFYEFYPQYFIYDRDELREETFNNDYSANEYINAAYAMIHHDIGNVMILGGIRFSKTDFNYDGRMPVKDSITGKYLDVDTISDSRKHEFLLPQMQVKYSPFEDFNIRAAYTESFSRPNFEDVIPYREEDRSNVKYGNPNLKFPHSRNFDFLVEKYIQSSGIISGGAFYKHITDFIFKYKINAYEDDPSMGSSKKHVEIPLNGEKAFVYGAELQLQFKFDFLPYFFKNFGVFSNYTYTYSEAYLHKRYPANDHNHRISLGEDYLLYFNSEEDEIISLPGQAKHTANFALFYETDAVYAKVSANYHDDFLYKIGVDPDLDEYYDKAWHFDFTAGYNITEKINVFTDIRNMSNAPLKFYLGTPDRIQKQEYYSWSGRIGVKINL